MRQPGAGERTVSVPSTLTEILAAHFSTEPVQNSGLAFPTPSGTPMRRSNFNKVWRRACRAADFDGTELERLTFHELRHTAAALAVEQGAHPLAIKERLGHSSITVTLDRYGGLFPSLDEALALGLDATLRSSLAAPSRPGQDKITHLRRSKRR